jgi:hypothetical protein
MLALRALPLALVLTALAAHSKPSPSLPKMVDGFTPISMAKAPVWRHESIADKPVLLLRRFDREAGARVRFLSAMSMLNARDNGARSYLEFADVLRQHGAAPKQDMQALWRRIVFSILISNTDDHLRNHGFLWAGQPAGGSPRPTISIRFRST